MTSTATTFAGLCAALNDCPEGEVFQHLRALADWLEEKGDLLFRGVRQAMDLDVTPSRNGIWASWVEGCDQDDAPIRDDMIVSSVWARLACGHESYAERAGVMARFKDYVGRWSAYRALAEALVGHDE
jgi:hypothetical protein